MTAQAAAEPREAVASRSGIGMLTGPLGAWLIVAFSVIGVGISIYLTTVHYAGAPLVCPRGGVINCQAVVTSPYSVIGHTNIPITVPGMAWFVISGALALLALYGGQRLGSLVENLPTVQLLWSAVGLVSVMYLVYVEAEKVHKICEWCTGVHVLILLTLAVAFIRWQSVMRERYAVAG